MLCPSCGVENPPGFAFCGQCGAALPLSCPHCGLENPAGFAFCGHCGADLSRSPSASFQTPLEGERRFVVILFADIAGFTQLSEQLNPEGATALVNRCLDVMTAAVARHGGRLDKYTGDGLMALFGAPTAHEDDPERALRAALAMQASVGRLELGADVSPISLHVGVACGQVVSAWVGGRGRRDYTAIGSAVNLACRLEQVSAIGQILVSEELVRLTDHAFSFKPVDLPRLQGWDEDVPAFELLGRRSGAIPFRRTGSMHAPLVGRETEMALLWQALEKLVAGQGSVLSVIGEAGIGKSRLLREMRALAEQRALVERRALVEQRGEGLAWLGGYAVETGQSVRYGCFRTLLRGTLGVTRQTAVSQTAERLWASLESLLPERTEQIYPYLGRLLGVSLAPEMSERLERLEGESLRWQTLQAVQEWVLALAARSPVVLVLEDLHWMDSSSAELLEGLLPLTEKAALAIVGAYRPEPDRPAWRLRKASRTQEDGYTELWLSPLSPAATDQMVRHLLQAEQVPEKALTLIFERTEGNPLFVEETVRSMVDQGVLVGQREGVWDLVSGWGDVAIPDTVQGLLQARVDRLDREAKRVLQVAACLGRQFPYRLLVEVAGRFEMPRQEVDRCLETLEEAALIQRETGPPEGNYMFRHVLVRDTVHRGLLKSARSQFHTVVAQWYEEHTLTEPEPPYALLAFHYAQAGDGEKQRLYCVEAGHQAAEGYANLEARGFFTQALALTTDPAERFELLLAREEVCSLMGDHEQQASDLQELLALADQSQDDRQRATVYYRFAIWHERRGDYGETRSALQEGLVAARRVGDVRNEAAILHRIASTAWRQGQFATALASSQDALKVARGAGDAEHEAASLTTMGVVHRSQGDLAAARDCYRQALDLRRASGDRRGEAISLNQLGNLLYDLGDYTGALDHHRQAFDIFRLVGDRQGEAWSLSGQGTIYLHCGEYEKARSCYEEALSLRRAIGDRRGEGVALSDLGSTLLRMGQWDVARTHLERAVTQLRDIGARRDQVRALTYLARAMEQTGDREGAKTTHQDALSQRLELGQVAASMENVSGLARMALERGDLETARTYTDQMLAHVRAHGLVRIGFPFQIYQTALRVLQASGAQQAARELLAEAHQTLQERAAGITDSALRRSFLERIPEHRELLAAWREEKE